MNLHSAYADVLVATPAVIQGQAAKSQLPPSSMGSIRPDNSVAGHNVYMDKAANGRPVVNINNPNSAGVSHNKFIDFNVDNAGIVINNSKDLVNSTLGGIVQGNTNLHNSARAIINEVTGSGRSYINGTQEIVGMKADYILANPNGISINGGGFINANRAAFTTGRVVLDAQGNLDKLIVEKGNIEILGRDLNVENLDYFDIIARTVKINAEIHAGREARVITGKGTLSVKDETFAPASNPAAPSISIDSGHLGGLYAGRISIVSNENGVGVNLPNMKSHSGDIEISASGKLVHKNIDSAAKVKIESRDSSVHASANVKANAKLELNYLAQGDIDIVGTAIVSAGNKVNVRSNTGLLRNQGKIISEGSGGLTINTKSLDNTGDIYAKNGNLAIDATGDITNKAQITSQQALRVNIAGKFQNNSVVSSFGPMFIMGDGSFENTKAATVRSKGSFYSSLVGDIDNLGEIIIAGGADFQPGKGINNTGKIEADYIEITKADGIANKGEMISRGKVELASTNDINNEGLVSATKEIDVRSDTDVINHQTGTITSLTSLKIEAAGALDNQGVYFGTSSGEFIAGTELKNSGSLESLADLQISSAATIENTGKIISATNMNMASVADISNSGQINAPKISIKSTAGGLLNSQNIIAEKSVKLVIAKDTNNSGKISALDTDIILRSSQGGLNNSGVIIAPTVTLATKTNIDNNNLIKATDIILDIEASLNNTGIIDAHNTSTITVGVDINNRSGTLLSGDTLKLVASNDLLNDDKSLILSKRAKIDFIVAGNVRNAGHMESALDLIGKSSKAIVNTGVILAHQDLTLDADIGIDNQAQAIIESDANLRLQSAGVLLNKGVIIADDDVSLVFTKDITNEGRIEALKGLFVVSNQGGINNTGQLLATHDSVYKSAGDFVNSKIISSDANLSIDSAGKVINQGTVVTGKAFTSVDRLGFLNIGGIAASEELVINSKDAIVNQGLILGEKVTTLQAVKGINNIDAGKIEALGDLTLISTHGKVVNINNDPVTYNDSGIIALASLSIKAANGVDNLGAYIEAKNDLAIVTNGNLNNIDATLLSKAGLRLLVDGEINNSGIIQSQNDMLINSVTGDDTASLANTGYISSSGKLDVKLAKNSQNNSVLQAKQAVLLAVSSGAFVNKGTVLSQSQGVTIATEGDLLNQKQGIIDALGNVALISNKGQIDNAGRVFSAYGAINVQAENDVQNKGSIIAKDNVTVNSSKGDVINNAGPTHIVSLTGDVIVDADKLVKNLGLFQAANALTIKAGIKFDNDGGKVITPDRVQINAPDIYNSKVGHIQADNIRLAATNKLDNAGILLAKSGVFTAQNDINNTGNIEVDKASLTSEAGNIHNAQYISSPGMLTLKAKQDIINNGDIEVAELVTESDKLINHKQIKADANLIVNNTTLLENHGLLDFGAMKADIVVVDNKKTGILKGRDLTIKAKDFLNHGATEVAGALKLDVENLISNVLLSKGKTDITIAGDFINNNKLHIIGNDLTLKAKSINNTGEFKARNFSATVTGAFNNSGMVFGSNSVAVNAPASINNSHYIISGGTTTLTTSGALINSKGIYGANSVTTNSATFTNSGELKSAGSVSSTAGSTTNTGTLAGRNALTINGYLNNSGTVISNSNVAVNAGGSAIDNAGNITSHGNVTLNSSTLSNRGVLQAVGTLSSHQSSNITNDYSIYGGVINLNTGGSITNNARIIANNTLSLTASGDVTNKQEISLLGNGNLAISGRNIYNDRKYQQHYNIVDVGILEAQSPTFRQKPDHSWGVYSLLDDWDWFDGTIGEYRADKIEKGGLIFIPNGQSFFGIPLGHHEQKHKFEYYDKQLSEISGVQPQISSGGNISLRSNNGTINNSTGIVSARNNINIDGANLVNADIVLKKHTLVAETHHTARSVEIDCSSGYGTKDVNVPVVTARPLYFAPEEILHRTPSLIQAGGIITGNLSGLVTNGSANSGGGKPVAMAQSGISTAGVSNYAAAAAEPAALSGSSAAYNGAFKKAPAQGLIAPAQSLSTVPAPPVKSPSAIKLSLQRDKQPRSAKASMDLPELSQLVAEMASQYEHPSSVHIAPESSVAWDIDDAEIMAALQGSDWDKPSAPGNYFIKETSPVFTDVEKYFSTDNFIKRIPDYNPKQSYIHYGDPVKQMDLVRRQMVELTGLASFDNGPGYIQQMKKLYDSGVDFGKELRLTPGVSLSKEQVAQLREDIVWAEEIELSGTKIIVPKLYAAASRRGEKASGILAKEIDLTAGAISNSSSIIGNTVKLTATKGDITNSQGGQVHAREHLQLESARDIRNIGAEISSSGSATLFAGGAIENITESKQYGDSRNYLTKFGPQAKIKVADKLTMQSLGDLVNRGASITSGDLDFAVGGSLRNESIAEIDGMESSGKGYHYKKSSVAYRPSSISASGDINGFVAGNFDLIGSRIDASGDSSISVLGDSRLLSQVASESVDSYSSSKTTNALGGTNTSSESYQSLAETLVPAAIKAGGTNTLINSRDQVLYGAEMHGGKGVYLKGRKTSILAARLDNYSASSSREKGMLLEDAESFGHKSSTHAHSILSGGPIEIESELLSIDYTKSTSGSVFGPKTITEHKPLWAQQLAGKEISWNPLSDQSESWYESETRLTPEASMVVSIGAAIGTAWMGGFGMFAAPATTTAGATTITSSSLVGTIGTAAWESALVGVASTSAVSMVNSGLNGKLDLAQLARDVTSKESLKSLGIGALTAGISAGVGQSISGAMQDKWGIALQLSSEMDLGQRVAALSAQSLVNTGVRTGLSGISGEGPSDIFSSELLSSTLALGQSVIGDIGIKHGLENGSLSKTALHSTLGGLYSAATGSSISGGIIGGAISEILPSLMESASGTTSPPAPSTIKAATQLTAATSVLLTGGSPKDVSNASKVALSSIEHNRELHYSEQRALQEAKDEAATAQERQDLEDAAAYLVAVHAGVNPEDNPVTQPELLASYQRGSTKIAAQKLLITKAAQYKQDLLDLSLYTPGFITPSQAVASVDARTFDYDSVDKSLDQLSYYGDYYTTRLGQATQLGAGAVGTGLSALSTGGSIVTGNVPTAALGVTATTFSALYTEEAYHALMSPYVSETGARALASLQGELGGPTGGGKQLMSAASTLLDVGVIKSAKPVASVLFKKAVPQQGVKQSSIVVKTVQGTPSGVGGAEAEIPTEGLKILRDKVGKVKGVEHTQIHHILHQKLKKHPLWEKAGMDVEDTLNKMLLPTSKGAVVSTTKRSIHQGRHYKRIEKDLREGMEKVFKNGKSQGYTQAQYKAALHDLINQERELLYDGTRALNKNSRPWSIK